MEAGRVAQRMGAINSSASGGREGMQKVLERSHSSAAASPLIPCLSVVCVVCGGMRVMWWCAHPHPLWHSHCSIACRMEAGRVAQRLGARTAPAGGGGEGYEKVLERSHPLLLPPLSFPASLVCVVCGGMQ